MRCFACKERFRLWPGDLAAARRTNTALVVPFPAGGIKVTVPRGKTLCYPCMGRARPARNLRDREVARTAASWAHEAILRADRGHFVLPEFLERARRKVAYDETHPGRTCRTCGEECHNLDVRDEAGRCLGCRGGSNYSGVAYAGRRRSGR